VKLVFILCISSLISCQDDENHTFEKLSGQLFTGTFYGSTPLTKQSPIAVTLSFESNRFSGESENQVSPIICEGTYLLTQQEIQFKNECTNEGVFKLSGTYSYKKSGDSLSIQRSYNGIMEVYQLIKR
jgi:hypothetical protein